MTLGEFSGYGYVILTVSLSVLFMGYVYHLYSAQRSGKRDYEKFSDIALHDEVTDESVEEIKEDSNKEDSQRKMEG